MKNDRIWTEIWIIPSHTTHYSMLRLTNHIKLKAFVVLLKHYIYTTYKSSFIFQIYLVDDSTGSIPSFIWYPVWTWMETTVEFYCPPWIIWDIPSPWLFLRQANLSNSTDILIHVGTDGATLTKTSLEMFLSLVWLHINKCFLLTGCNWRTRFSLWDRSTGKRWMAVGAWHQPKMQIKFLHWQLLWYLKAGPSPSNR